MTPGDRLHASAHAWASDTATDVTIDVIFGSGIRLEVTTPVVEPGPLIAMKLQAVMNRSAAKQGTDLLDIVRLTLDRDARPRALGQLKTISPAMARDIALHVDLWFNQRRTQAVRWIQSAGGMNVTADDLDLIAELLLDAVAPLG